MRVCAYVNELQAFSRTNSSILSRSLKRRTFQLSAISTLRYLRKVSQIVIMPSLKLFGPNSTCVLSRIITTFIFCLTFFNLLMSSHPIVRHVTLITN